MKALLIGGNGFLGSHIADSLLKIGSSVRCLDLYPEIFRDPLSGVEYHFGSFLDPAALNAALDGIDVVYHLASTTIPATAAADPMRDVQENLLGSLGVLQALRSRGIRRLIFVSSGGTVYGSPQYLPVTETHPLQPQSSYGIVKTAIEGYVDEMRRSGMLDSLVFRLSNPFGPRQNPFGQQGFVAAALSKVQAGEQVEIWGDGSVVRDFVYVEDVADLFSRAALSDQTGVFNVGTGRGLSLNDIITTIQSVVGCKLPVKYTGNREIDIPASYLDISAIKRSFGWFPQTDLETGIARTWEWTQGLPAQNAKRLRRS